MARSRDRQPERRRQRLLLEELDKAWRERQRGVPLDRTPTFRHDGLVLGAGALLIAADTEQGRLLRLDGPAESRLLVLLSAAYARRVGAEVLGHVRRAVIRWSEGDTELASLHLALAGLGPLSNPRESSRRLFLAERLIEAGADADTLLRALDLGVGPNALARAYNPDEPRVPAGNGRGSGQWTSGDEVGPLPIREQRPPRPRHRLAHQAAIAFPSRKSRRPRPKTPALTHYPARRRPPNYRRLGKRSNERYGRYALPRSWDLRAFRAKSWLPWLDSPPRWSVQRFSWARF
jgi:hypothetical protein